METQKAEEVTGRQKAPNCKLAIITELNLLLISCMIADLLLLLPNTWTLTHFQSIFLAVS
jgi:hypothetical protein